jgi:hypothetical protein
MYIKNHATSLHLRYNLLEMSLFKGEYLRVMSPVTVDGMVPKIGTDGRQVYKEDHLPVSAKKGLERRNLKYPPHLRKTIEIVPAYQPEPVQQPERPNKKR